MKLKQQACRVADGGAEEDDGLLIFDSDTITPEEQHGAEAAQQADRGLGGCSSQAGTVQAPAVTQLVAFPGINGPIPEGADSQRWHHALSSGQVRLRMHAHPPHAALTYLQQGQALYILMLLTLKSRCNCMLLASCAQTDPKADLPC